MDLKARITRPIDQFIAGQSLGERRLEVMAAERDVQRFLKGKQPATDLAANKLAQIVVGDRVHYEEVGHAYLADPHGFEMACRGPLRKLRYLVDRALARAFGGG